MNLIIKYHNIFIHPVELPENDEIHSSVNLISIWDTITIFVSFKRYLASEYTLVLMSI